MLDGGLVARRPYLIVGPSGAGKSTLALQFLCAGVRNGERTLLVTVEDPPNEVRANHRGLAPELGKVDVFDAIPDVMRYERAPFKDIAAVRSAMPFESVSEEIRHTPELTSIEVTITALEQMLRSEVQRRTYSRIVIDSLTALQYFCMKGFDIVAGAQTFLRFLSDLRVTTVLTVEAPLEDVETPERMLARGEIRLFRWELNDTTVRAVGVEKFRGSSHDIRLHPYRIGPRGLDINLGLTISRDTRQIVDSLSSHLFGPAPPGPVEAIPSTLDVLTEELHDLVIVGADMGPIHTELEAAMASARLGDIAHATERLTRAVALGAAMPEPLRVASRSAEGEFSHALRRMATRAESSRAGQPLVRVPELPILTARLAKILAELKLPVEPVPAGPVPSPNVPSPTSGGETRRGPSAAAGPTPISVAPEPPEEVPSAPPDPLRAVPPLHPSHPARASPPPLPRAVRLPETEPRVRPPRAPSVPSPAHPPPPAPTPAPVAPVGQPLHEGPVPVGSLTASPVTVAGEAAPVLPPPEVSAPKKRRRSATGSRKKAATPTPKDPLAPPATVLVAPTVPAVPEPTVELPTVVAPRATVPSDPHLPADPGTNPPARPTRRVVRKKKAPSVVGATPGPLLEGSASEPSPPPSGPSPVERPPEAT